MANQYIRYPNPISSTAISGSGTSGQVAYFTGTNTISSSANFLFDGTNITVGGIIGSAAAPLKILSVFGNSSWLALYHDGSGNAVINNTFATGSLSLGTNSITGLLMSSSQVLTLGAAAADVLHSVNGGLNLSTQTYGIGINSTPSASFPLSVRNDQNGSTQSLLRNSNAGASALVRGSYQTTAGNLDITVLSTAAGAYAQVATDSGFTSGLKITTNGTNPLELRTNNTLAMSIDGTNQAVSISGGNLKITNAGSGLFVKEGSNATMGTATLSGGTILVNNTTVTANTRIFLTVQSVGVLANLGSPYISARSAGASFTISSSNILDTSVVAWIMVEPA